MHLTPFAQKISFFAARATTAEMGSWLRGCCTKRARRSELILLADPADLRGDAAEMFRKLTITANQCVLRGIRKRTSAFRPSCLICIWMRSSAPVSSLPSAACMQRPFDF